MSHGDQSRLVRLMPALGRLGLACIAVGVIGAAMGALGGWIISLMEEIILEHHRDLESRRAFRRYLHWQMLPIVAPAMVGALLCLPVARRVSRAEGVVLLLPCAIGAGVLSLVSVLTAQLFIEEWSGIFFRRAALTGIFFVLFPMLQLAKESYL